MSSAAFHRWVKRIDSGVFTKTECRAYARLVWPIAHDLCGNLEMRQTHLVPDEALKLCEMMTIRGGVRLTEDHTEQGLKYLKSRRGHQVLGLVIHPYVVERFDHFRYMGAACWLNDQVFHPVWRVVMTTGDVFDYAVPSWQSGQSVGIVWPLGRATCGSG